MYRKQMEQIIRQYEDEVEAHRSAQQAKLNMWEEENMLDDDVDNEFNHLYVEIQEEIKTKSRIYSRYDLGKNERRYSFHAQNYGPVGKLDLR